MLSCGITKIFSDRVNSYPPFGLGKVFLKLGTDAVLQVLLRGSVSCNPGTGRRSEWGVCEEVPKRCLALLLHSWTQNYHSCQSASCAVILSIWSTSINRQTSSLAAMRETQDSFQGAPTVRFEKQSKYFWNFNTDKQFLSNDVFCAFYQRGCKKMLCTIVFYRGCLTLFTCILNSHMLLIMVFCKYHVYI